MQRCERGPWRVGVTRTSEMPLQREISVKIDVTLLHNLGISQVDWRLCNDVCRLASCGHVEANAALIKLLFLQ